MKKLLVLSLLLLLAGLALADSYTIGTGTSASSVTPYYGSYNYGWAKTIYTQAEISAAGLTTASNIVGIGFYIGNTPANYVMQSQSVYVRNTTASVYETTDNTYPGNTAFTNAFTGTITYNGSGWHYITFSTPFAWDGTSNIEFLYENLDTDNPTGYPTFRYTSTTPDYRSVYKGDDTSFPGTVTGTRTYTRSNIMLVTATTTAPSPALVLNPLDGAILVPPATLLSWMQGSIWPTGYRLNLGTNNPPNNVVDNQDLGNVTSYDPTPDLQPNTTYYWQVIPYNTFGDAAACPVWSFTTHGDPTITALPYNQAWDNVTIPALPFDWTSIVQASVTTAYVKTVTTSPNTTPNCLGIYNSTDASATVIAVGPQLAANIPANSVRVKFWGKGSAAYHLLVGVMTNPADPATFVSVQDVNTIANWNQYVVDLTPYTGAGQYIAFKHACASTSQTIYVDGVSFEQIAPNDLAATTVTGNTTPSVNTLTSYTVGIRNWGTASQSTYTVKLYDGSNVELASVAGPTIAAGAETSVQLSFTPTVQGPMVIYGKVILDGDINPANDQTPPFNISVMPPGAVVVTIGAGDQNQRVPVDMYYKNSVWEGIYFASEMNVFGVITALTFYNNFLTDLPNKPVKVWLGNSNLADLSGGWIAADQYTLVFNGNINFPTGENTITIPLQTPFAYTTGNLIMRVNRPMDTAYFSSSDYFKGQTIGTNRARKLQSDTVEYDPLAPSAAGTMSGIFPKTSITFVTDTMGSLSGSVTSGGQPISGATVVINATTYNTTTGADGLYSFPFVLQGAYTVTASKVGYESQTQPVTIVANQASTLNFILPASSNVNVTGTVVGSAAPTVGLAGATVSLDGVVDYEGVTNALGQFTITGVLTGNPYTYLIQKTGYQDLTGSITVGTTAYNMGTLVMPELALPVSNLAATENAAQTQVGLIWRVPGSNGGGGVEDFEIDNGEWVPTSNWTNPLGDWQWTNTYNVANHTDIDTYVDDPPTAAHSGTGMWGTVIQGGYTNCGGWSYLKKTFNLSGITSPVLDFWHYMDGYNTWDYGLVKVNGTTVWGSSAAAEFMPWQELVLDLTAYANQTNVEISFEWYATTTVSYSGWYIDDVYVGPATGRTVNYAYTPISGQTVSGMETAGIAQKAERWAKAKTLKQPVYADSRDPGRPLGGYKVWRLTQGNESNEASWFSLTPNAITDTTYTDLNWAAMPDGNYKWAVKAVYTNNVLSVPVLSNMIRIQRLDLSALSVSGTSTPSVGMAATYTVRVENTGTTTQQGTAYTVKLMGGAAELASVSGVTLAPGEEHDFAISWTPTTAGPLVLTGKVVLPNDSVPANDVSPGLDVSVMAAGTIAITVGTGDQVEGKPLDFYYNNSLFQCLYYPSEIGLFGNITALTFYNNFITDLPNKPVKFWLGSTQLADLSGGYILPTELTVVYDGNISFPAGENSVTIPLQTPYAWSGGNLVLYAHRPMEATSYNTNDNFKTQTVGSNRARKLASDTTTYDPAAPAAGTLSGSFPQTTFHMTSLGPNPVFVVTPGSKDWGTVLINSINDQVFTISNAGTGALVVNTIEINGNFFQMLEQPTLPLSLGFGQTASFTVRYLPTVAGAHTGTVTINDNMTRLPHVINLAGNCIDTTIHTLPYAQNFDAVTQPALPPDWTSFVDATVTGAVVKTYTTTPHSPLNTAGMTNSTDQNATLLLIAPPLAANLPINTSRVKFWGRSSGSGYLLSVGVLVNPSDPATYTEVQNISLTTTWTQYIVSLAGYTGAGQAPAFKHGLGGSSRTLYIDDYLIEGIFPNDLAAVSVAGPAAPVQGAQTNYQVSVMNWGSDPQATYQVKLFTQDNVEVGSVAGLAVNPGQTVQVNIPWTPSTAGPTYIYGKTVMTTDQAPANDQSPNLYVAVMPQGVININIGDGGQNARLPMDFYYKNSLFENLYTPTEVGAMVGNISGISFYGNLLSNVGAKPTKIWLGTTQLADLSGGWVPSTELTLVFDGMVNYPSGVNTIPIVFNQPYLYLGGGNLVLLVQRPMEALDYNTADYFDCQTIGTNRARKAYSDTVTYDPAAPPAGTLTGQFPRTTLHIIPGGVGHLNGTVLGAGNTPLEGVSIEFATGGYSAVTNAQGQYSIQNILDDTYQVTYSKHGYISQTLAIVIPEDQTVTQNVTLIQMPTVTVSGTILASDTSAGLSGAAIYLTGYENYNVNSTATGSFSFPAVYANQSYSYSVLRPGYNTAIGTINVGATNYAMGNITLTEVAYAPGNVQAETNTTNTEVNLSWVAPDPNAVEITEGFEGTSFPPLDWTVTTTNTGAANSSGVYPTWCRFGNITVGTTPVPPTEGTWQAGTWWSYEHQDEWMITPTFNCPPSAYLNFDGYVFLGSTAGDHYYVKVSTDNGANWTPLWDASAQTGGWNYYASPISIDLAAFGGQQIKLAFHAIDPPSNDGLWYVWFVDNIYIGNAQDVLRFAGSELEYKSASGSRAYGAVASTSPSRAVEIGQTRAEAALPTVNKDNPNSSRSLVGYKVWRLSAGSEANPNSWIPLTPETITNINLTDTGWAALADGNYRWAVKAIYTASVTSVASFSNILAKDTVTGMISGVVRRLNNQPIPGATVTAGTYTATTNNSGAYVIIVPTGTYTVTASHVDYLTGTVENVTVNADQTTTVNFTLTGVGIDDEVIPATATALLGNYPNPFNPSTSISYSVKDPAAVQLVIFNVKGQKIRTLVNQNQTNGKYNVVWNGKDDNNQPVGSGVYYYRMSAGKYISSKKMLLVE